MAKKSVKVDELVELLKDDKITELLVQRLKDMLQRKIDKLFERY